MAREGVVDASLLLSLGDVSALHLLWDDADHDWHITPIVRGEVISEPTRSEISHALLQGHLASAELDLDSQAELSALARWSRVVDPGEAEAIAVAAARGWLIGIEDLFAQRRLTQELGASRWVNAAGLLVKAVRAGRLSLSAADAIFVRLDCYSGYAKRGIVALTDLM